jgi:hypothetical protein
VRDEWSWSSEAWVLVRWRIPMERRMHLWKCVSCQKFIIDQCTYIEISLNGNFRRQTFLCNLISYHDSELSEFIRKYLDNYLGYFLFVQWLSPCNGDAFLFWLAKELKTKHCSLSNPNLLAKENEGMLLNQQVKGLKPLQGGIPRMNGHVCLWLPLSPNTWLKKHYRVCIGNRKLDVHIT